MTDSPERWRAVIAALLDGDARAVLGETATGDPLTPKRRARAIERLERAGAVRREKVTQSTDAATKDAVTLDHAALRALLASPPRPTGPERFLDADGRIDRYPAAADERRALLVWVAGRAFSAEDVLDEAEVGERLLPYAPSGDVAVLRRYLVDHGILERTPSGSEYALARE